MRPKLLSADRSRTLTQRELNRALLVRSSNVRTPHSVNTFLVDGSVAGSWRFEAGRMEIEPFRRLDAVTSRELDQEGERLTALHA